jgi:hypothetical protein
VVEHEFHLVGNGVLVDRNRRRTERLHRRDRPIEARPVIADDRYRIVAAQTQNSETAGERANFGSDLRPGPRLPDTEVLLAHGRPRTAHRRVALQQLGKGIVFGVERRTRPKRRTCRRGGHTCPLAFVHRSPYLVYYYSTEAPGRLIDFRQFPAFFV